MPSIKKIPFTKSISGILAITVGFVMVFGVTAAASAAPNPEINYQGKLTTSSGVAVTDGSYNIEFKLYTTATGGTAVWTEDDLVSNSQGVSVTGGLFSIMLGAVTPLTGVNFNQPLYLGVNIGGTGATPSWDGEMTPRKILGTVPAAFVADTLNGYTSNEFIRSDAANSTSTASTFLSIAQSGAGDIADFIGQSSTPALTIKSNGAVGVGTTTPFGAFSVAGDAYIGGNLTATGTVTLAPTLNGFLDVKNGVVSASSTLAIAYGGTGTSTAPLANMLLVSDANGNWEYVATSSLGFASTTAITELTSTLTSNYVPKWTGSAFTNSLITDTGTAVGIGTSTPLWNLQVAGANGTLALSDTGAPASEQNWTLQSSNGSFYLSQAASPTASTSYIRFDNGSNRNNTALGAGDLSLATGGNNTALGYQAGLAVTSALDQTLIGYQAGINTSNSSSQQNTAVGYQAGYSNVTGSFNTYLGASAIGAAAGNYNTLIGAYAGYGFSTSGANSNNTIVGYNAVGGAAAASTGNDTIVGYQAGYNLNNGNNNTLFGNNTGYALTSGGNNLFLGYQTASTTSSGSNNVAIGNNIDLPVQNGSNQLDLGNLIYATGLNGSGTTLSTGNVGIGTTSPFDTLSVAGTGYFAGNVTATNLIATGTLTLAPTLTGSLQALNGIVSASSTISVAYGGTGLSVSPSYGQLLLGQSNGLYALTATSSLGLLGSSIAATTYVPYTGAVASVDLNNQILSNISTLSVGSTVTPTNGVAYFNGAVGIGATSLSNALFKVAASSSSIIDNYSNQNEIFSLSDITWSPGQLQLTQAVCGTYTVTGPDGLTYGTVLGADGNCWLDRNLGATEVANSSTDYNAYGSLFQWGRLTDGHQLITWTSSTSGTPVNGATTTLSSTDNPGTNEFIEAPNSPYDWRSPQNNNLWQGVNGTNNVCPAGFEVPTQAQWATLVSDAGITNAATAFSSSLKLPLAGYRNGSSAGLYYQASGGFYWSSSVNGTDAYTLVF